MKEFQNFLKKVDIFGVPFNFKYKSKDKFATPFGGFILLLFCVLALSFGIYYFIPFLNRKNLNIIYYTMNLPKTESIILQDSQTVFNIGINCEENVITDIKYDEIFNLEINYILYIKNIKGEYDKKKHCSRRIIAKGKTFITNIINLMIIYL